MHHNDGPYLPARPALLLASRHDVTNLTERPSNFAQSPGNRVGTFVTPGGLRGQKAETHVRPKTDVLARGQSGFEGSSRERD